MSETIPPKNSGQDASTTPQPRPLRPWGKYGFVSSIMLTIFMIACLVSFFATFSFETESPAYVAGLFYCAVGFAIGSVVFSGIGLATGRNKLYAGLGLGITGFAVGIVLLMRSVLGAA